MTTLLGLCGVILPFFLLLHHSTVDTSSWANPARVLLIWGLCVHGLLSLMRRTTAPSTEVQKIISFGKELVCTNPIHHGLLNGMLQSHDLSST